MEGETSCTSESRLFFYSSYFKFKSHCSDYFCYLKQNDYLLKAILRRKFKF